MFPGFLPELRSEEVNLAVTLSQALDMYIAVSLETSCKSTACAILISKHLLWHLRKETEISTELLLKRNIIRLAVLDLRRIAN